MRIADKQHAHELLERVPADQMSAAVRFLVARSTEEEDEEISPAEEQAVVRSKE